MPTGSFESASATAQQGASRARQDHNRNLDIRFCMTPCCKICRRFAPICRLAKARRVALGVNRESSGLTSSPSKKESMLDHDIQIDARGLFCPEPLMLVKNKVRELAGGDVLHILATDPTTERDFEHFRIPNL